jgi:type I restriction enzyme M protein
MRIEEFEPEKAWWTDRKETQFAWTVSIEQIRERGFNLDITNPNAPQHTHADPDTLLALFNKERAAATELREELRKVLAAALLSERG